MNTTKLCAAALCSVLLTACASSPDSESKVASAQEVANPDEVTCRTKVKTGTRIGTKVCKTNRAWALGNSSGRNMAEAIQRGSLQSVGDSNAGN
ncbi:MAG: hypothetical protein ABJ308_14330 [Halieaceae bacterium]